MSLINWKIELKLKCTKNCVLPSTGADNANANSNDIIFIIKDKTLYVTVVKLSAKDNQKLSKLFSKNLTDRCIGMNMEQKVRVNKLQTSIDIFWDQTS